jgi:hypothetical protein
MDTQKKSLRYDASLKLKAKYSFAFPMCNLKVDVQIFLLVRKSQIYKLACSSSQIANLQSVTINPQIANPLISSVS